jgi:hypothetical protein
VSINVWRLAGDTLNITCNFLYCNDRVHTEVLITLYNSSYWNHFEITFLWNCLRLRSRSYWSAARTHSLMVNASIKLVTDGKQQLLEHYTLTSVTLITPLEKHTKTSEHQYARKPSHRTASCLLSVATAHAGLFTSRHSGSRGMLARARST